MSSLFKVIGAALLLSFAPAESMKAQWVPDSTANNPVCTANGNQANPRVVADGTGGAIITWEDSRNSPLYPDIYAQRFDSSGVIQWSINGLPICTSPNEQSDPHIAPDDSGGAVVAWSDRRNGSYYKVFAQRLGLLGPLWPPNGTEVCTVMASQITPALIGDGRGGAIVVWEDYRTFAVSGTDLYAQRLDDAGIRRWGNASAKVCSVQNDQVNPQILRDGSGGAFIAWEDRRQLSDRNLYLQHIDSTGARLWSDSGLALCRAPNEQSALRIASDGGGGIIAVWEDQRNGPGNTDIYAQRVTRSGVQWQADGVPVCTNSFNQFTPELATHSLGGVVIVWQDNRTSSTGDIYAQWLDTTGTPQWPIDGLGICTNTNPEVLPHVIPDGAGGNLVTWDDGRIAGWDVFAQRLDASGTPLWQANGSPVSVAVSDQMNSRIALPSAGSGIVVWEDLRNNALSGADIYSSRINSHGTLTDVEIESAPGEFVLGQNYPNPFNPTTDIRYQLPASGSGQTFNVRLVVYDLLGRQVRVLVDDKEGPGRYEVKLDASGLASGVYFYRLSSGAFSETRKMIAVK
jgi:hypothetical protein